MSQGLRQSMQKVYDSRKKIYDLTIRIMVEFFPDIELEEECERRDKLLDDFEESKRGQKIGLMDERRGDKWR